MKTTYIVLVVASIAASSALSYVAGRNVGRGESRLESEPEFQRLSESLQLEKQQVAGLLDTNQREKAESGRLNAKRAEGIGTAREIAGTLRGTPPQERESLRDTLLASLETSFPEFPGDVAIWTEFVDLSVHDHDQHQALVAARDQIRDYEARVEENRKSETEGLPPGMLRVKPIALSE